MDRFEVARATLHDGHPQGDADDDGVRGDSLEENVIASTTEGAHSDTVTFHGLKRRVLGDLAYVVFFDDHGDAVAAHQLAPGTVVKGDLAVSTASV